MKRRAAPARWRILRVAELLDADPADVRRRTDRLPGSISAVVVELAAGTLLTLEVHRRWWDHLPRPVVLAGLNRRLSRIEDETSRRTVVAAAIVDRGRVLVAQRSRPAELAGRWEFPGGKLERGETPAAALVRECAEELGCSVTVAAELATGRVHDGGILRLFRAELAPGSATPKALEHQQLNWVEAGSLQGLDWVGRNRDFLPAVADQL